MHGNQREGVDTFVEPVVFTVYVDGCKVAPAEVTYKRCDDECPDSYAVYIGSPGNVTWKADCADVETANMLALVLAQENGGRFVGAYGSKS